MKSLAQIEALYEEIDGHFETHRQDRLASRDDQGARRVEKMQLLSDQAYFVLCWGQLEAEIDDACRAAIRRRSNDARWEMRRGFDLYKPDKKRISGLRFEHRVAMILDRDQKTYAKVMDYYRTRNKIAHGKLAATRIDVTAVVADFYVVQAELTR